MGRNRQKLGDKRDECGESKELGPQLAGVLNAKWAESSWRLIHRDKEPHSEGEGFDFLGMKALLSLPLKIP